MKKKRIKIGFFSFTGCEGCIVTVLEILNSRYKSWLPLVDIQIMRVLKPIKKPKGLDVAFVEGAISTDSEERKLREIRKNSKKLVAIGSSAMGLGYSVQRNLFNAEQKVLVKGLVKRLHQKKKVLGVKDVVKVDDTVPGCPVEEKGFARVFEKYLKEFSG